MTLTIDSMTLTFCHFFTLTKINPHLKFCIDLINSSREISLRNATIDTERDKHRYTNYHMDYLQVLYMVYNRRAQSHKMPCVSCPFTSWLNQQIKIWSKPQLLVMSQLFFVKMTKNAEFTHYLWLASGHQLPVKIGGSKIRWPPKCHYF